MALDGRCDDTGTSSGFGRAIAEACWRGRAGRGNRVGSSRSPTRDHERVTRGADVSDSTEGSPGARRGTSALESVNNAGPAVGAVEETTRECDSCRTPISTGRPKRAVLPTWAPGTARSCRCRASADRAAPGFGAYCATVRTRGPPGRCATRSRFSGSHADRRAGAFRPGVPPDAAYLRTRCRYADTVGRRRLRAHGAAPSGDQPGSRTIITPAPRSDRPPLRLPPARRHREHRGGWPPRRRARDLARSRRRDGLDPGRGRQLVVRHAPHSAWAVRRRAQDGASRRLTNSAAGARTPGKLAILSLTRCGVDARSGG